MKACFQDSLSGGAPGNVGKKKCRAELEHDLGSVDSKQEADVDE